MEKMKKKSILKFGLNFEKIEICNKKWNEKLKIFKFEFFSFFKFEMKIYV
jgi:hypothetical protein